MDAVRNMAESSNSKIDQSRLDAVFHPDGTVTHTFHTLDSSTSQRLPVGTMTWSEKKRLGSGGFGSVVLQGSDTGELRAVKRLYREQRINYRMELKALSKISDRHDLFVEFLGWYEGTLFIFIAMEYIQYGDLGQYMESGEHKVGCNIREITRQVLKGLEALHDRDICHRDLKPQNILVASPEPVWVKIADFGASKNVKGTQLRTRIGTMGYIAPEVLGLLPSTRGRHGYTKAVDLWALGCIIYEMLTSRTPFTTCAMGSISECSGVRSDTPFLPELDFLLLHQFCMGDAELPVEMLEGLVISNNATTFVQSLLLADPSSRPSASAALKLPWLLETDDIRIDPTILPEVVFDPETRDTHSTTVPLGPQLLEAASAGETERVAQLLGQGGDIEDRGNDHRTPLLRAVFGGHTQTVDLLLYRGANIMAEDNNHANALVLAASVGSTEVVALLLDHGAEIAARDENGDTALLTAAHNGHTGVVVQLLSRGATIEERGSNHMTALLHAAMGGHTQTVGILLDSGADIKAMATDQATSLVLAVQGGHTEVLSLLLHHGAELAEMGRYRHELLLNTAYSGYTRSVVNHHHCMPHIPGSSDRTVAFIRYPHQRAGYVLEEGDGRIGNCRDDTVARTGFKASVVPLDGIYLHGNVDIDFGNFPPANNSHAGPSDLLVVQFTGCSEEVVKAYLKAVSRMNRSDTPRITDRINELVTTGPRQFGGLLNGVSLLAAPGSNDFTLYIAIPYPSLEARGHGASLVSERYEVGRPDDTNITGVMTHQAQFILANDSIAVFQTGNNEAQDRAPLHPHQQYSGPLHALIQIVLNVTITSELPVIKNLQSAVANQEYHLRNAINQNTRPAQQLMLLFDKSMHDIGTLISILESQVKVLYDIHRTFESVKGGLEQSEPNDNNNLGIPVTEGQNEVYNVVEIVKATIEERKKTLAGLQSWLEDMAHSRILVFSHGAQEAAAAEAFELARVIQAEIVMQGQALSMFTIVTVMFLPLGFFSSYFALSGLR